MSEAVDRARHYYFVGRNFEQCDLTHKDLRGINFTCCNFRRANLEGSDLRGAIFIGADLSQARLLGCNAEGADFCAADLTNSYLRAVDFTNAKMWHVCLKGAICKNTKFFGADLTGADFCRADMLGARFDNAIVTGVRNIDRAIFRWFMNPDGGRPSYDPFPGAVVLTESVTGEYTFQENAGLGQSGLSYERAMP